MESVEIKNILPTFMPGFEAVPLKGVMKEGGKQVVILFHSRGQRCLAHLYAFDKDVDLYTLSDLLPDCKVD